MTKLSPIAVLPAFCLLLTAVADASVLRVCANPDNLPLSQEARPPKGLYVDIAHALGKKLGMDVEYVWVGDYSEKSVKFAFERDLCDVYPGLPLLGRWDDSLVRLTRPYMRQSYALVVPKGRHEHSLADLKGRRVAVQFRTPPQNFLAAHDDITAVTYTTAKEAMEGLAKGEADAAFVWGPVAGYYNKFVLHDAYRVIPTRGPGLDWAVAMGVRADAQGLYRAIEQALPKLNFQLLALARRYGISQEPPLTLHVYQENLRWPGDGYRYSEFRPWFRPAHLVLVADASGAEPYEAPASKGEERNSSASSGNSASAMTRQGDPPTGKSEAQLVEEGRALFNSNCGHCHGPNAVTGDSFMDLPALLREQGKNMDEFFYRTVTTGIPSVGMPTWGGVLSREQMTKILLFLHAVQKERFGDVIETSDPSEQKPGQ